MDDETTQREAHNRVLLLGQRFAFNTGLLVSRVLGLRNIQDWQQHETNGEVSYQDGNGQVWRKLDINHLLHQPDFLQIGA
jgi:twitching motility protein PilI